MKNILIFLFASLLLTNIACENEPVNIPDINLVNAELLGYIKLISEEPEDRDFNCIEFNYSFTVFIYDEELNFEDAIVVFDNTNFINILGNLEETQSISLSYPIAGTLNNGEQVSINTNEELAEALRECSLINTQRRYGNALKSCDWLVAPTELGDNPFEGNRVSLLNDGRMLLYNNTTVYKGTWITLYIGEVLHLNLNLNGDAEVQEFWNHNWETISATEDFIEIVIEDTPLTLTRDCFDLCDTPIYEECEFTNEPGFADFNLSSFIRCIVLDQATDLASAVSYTFYQTEEEAITNVNAIDAEQYTNTENNQVIYVRIEYKTTNELIEIQTITINAVPCTDG